MLPSVIAPTSKTKSALWTWGKFFGTERKNSYYYISNKLILCCTNVYSYVYHTQYYCDCVCVCARARVCVCVCVCGCVYVYVFIFFHRERKTYLRVRINDLVLWILVGCFLPSSIISVSENVIFHLQRRKLQPTAYWRENDMI